MYSDSRIIGRPAKDGRTDLTAAAVDPGFKLANASNTCGKLTCADGSDAFNAPSLESIPAITRADDTIAIVGFAPNSCLIVGEEWIAGSSISFDLRHTSS